MRFLRSVVESSSERLTSLTVENLDPTQIVPEGESQYWGDLSALRLRVLRVQFLERATSGLCELHQGYFCSKLILSSRESLVELSLAGFNLLLLVNDFAQTFPSLLRLYLRRSSLPISDAEGKKRFWEQLGSLLPRKFPKLSSFDLTLEDKEVPKDFFEKVRFGQLREFQVSDEMLYKPETALKFMKSHDPCLKSLISKIQSQSLNLMRTFHNIFS